MPILDQMKNREGMDLKELGWSTCRQREHALHCPLRRQLEMAIKIISMSLLSVELGSFLKVKISSLISCLLR
jgi:hypothetical protein